MKKKWTRLSALFLAVLMAITCLPFTVWAAEGDETVNLSQGMTVYASGYSDNFLPGNAVDGITNNASNRWGSNKMKNLPGSGGAAASDLIDDAVSWIVIDLWKNQNGQMLDPVDTITSIAITYTDAKDWATEGVVQVAADQDVTFDGYTTNGVSSGACGQFTDPGADDRDGMGSPAWTTIATIENETSTTANSDGRINNEWTTFETDVPEGVRYVRFYFTAENYGAAGATYINIRELTVMGTRKAAEPEQPEQPEAPERVTGERQYELVTEDDLVNGELESGYYVLRSWPKDNNPAVATIRREANASAVSECKDITIGDGKLNLVGGHDDEHVWLVLKTEDGYTIQSMSEGNGYLNHAASTSSSTNLPVSDTPATFQITYGTTDGANGAAVTNAFAVSWDNNGTSRYINHSGSVWHGWDGWGIGIAFYKEVSNPTTTDPDPAPSQPSTGAEAYTPEQAVLEGKTVKYLCFTGGTSNNRWWDATSAAGDTAKIHLYSAAGTATNSAITLDTNGIEAGNYTLVFGPATSKPAVMHYSSGVSNQCSGPLTTVSDILHLFTLAAAEGSEYSNAFTIEAYNTNKYLSLDASGSQRAFKDDKTTFYVTPTNANNDGTYYIWITEEPEPPVDYSTWDKADISFSGTTNGEPFSTEDVGTQMYRIPAIITLDNGWLVAAADVRWAGWNDNPANLDTIVSVSKDNGKTWEWEVVNYFGDYANTVQGMPSGSNPGSAAFIDPVLVQAADGKVWMAIDVTAANGKATAGSTGYDSQNRILVTYAPDYVDLKAPTNPSLYTYYVSKVGESYEVDGESITLYPIESSTGAQATGYAVDAFMNLYKVANGTAAKEWCKQEGAEKAVQTNLFYKQSAWKVFPTCFIMLRSAEVNKETGKLEWGDPIFTNTRYAGQTQPFYGVCPGRGTVTEDGRIIFPVYDNATGEKTSTIYSDDNGATWQRGNRTPISHGGKTSESQIITLPDGTLRMYSRNDGGTRNASYSDSTDGGVNWSATKADTGLQHGSNCMYSIINVVGILNGPNGESYENVVMVSYPEGNGGASAWDNRSNGSLRIGYISGSTQEGWTINWLGTPKTYHGSASTYFAYSCLTQFHDLDSNEPMDGFCALYEPNDNTTQRPNLPVDIWYKEFDVAYVLGEGWTLSNPTLTLDKETVELTLTENETVTETVTATVGNAPEGTVVVWNSSNESVATVDGGVITAVGEGTATITASVTAGGITRTVEVQVTVIEPGEHVHTAGEARRENVIEATCAAEGSYDEVVRCSVCNEVMSSEPKTIAKLDHTASEAVRENVTEATCAAEGSYDEVVYCSVCNEVMSSEHKTIEKLDHTAGEAVRENVTEATCEMEGSYDEVVRCSECSEVMSSEHKTIEKQPHTEVIDLAVDPTDTETGLTQGIHCSVCGEVIVAQEIIPALTAPTNPSAPSAPGTSLSPITPVTPVTPPDEGDEEIDDNDPPLAELPFIDVDQNAWYAQSVASVHNKGLMNGMSDMIFAPKEILNRGMMAQILHNIAKNPAATAAAPFADLNNRYYTEAVAWGVANGILKGYSDTLYGGEDALTREQMAAMLYRYVVAQGLGQDVDMSVLDGFVDSARISGYAKEAVAWAVENGLLQGRGNNDLDPRANITRAEVAAVLDRYAKLFLA